MAGTIRPGRGISGGLLRPWEVDIDFLTGMLPDRCRYSRPGTFPVALSSGRYGQVGPDTPPFDFDPVFRFPLGLHLTPEAELAVDSPSSIEIAAGVIAIRFRSDPVSDNATMIGIPGLAIRSFDLAAGQSTMSFGQDGKTDPVTVVVIVQDGELTLRVNGEGRGSVILAEPIRLPQVVRIGENFTGHLRRVIISPIIPTGEQFAEIERQK